MHTEYFMLKLFVLNYSTQRKEFKHVINALENAIRVVDVLTESLLAFLSKAEVPIYRSILMVASQNDHLRENIKRTHPC